MFSVGYFTVYLGGLLTLLAPCSAMLLPSFFSFAFNSSKQMLIKIVIFYVGLLCALLPLGVAVGVVGGLFKVYFSAISTIISLMIILIGVMQIFSVKISFSKLLVFKKRNIISGSKVKSTSNFGVFLLGFSYAIIGGGCSGPILGVVLGSLAIYGNVYSSVALMIFYALGMITPVAIMAIFWNALKIPEKKYLQPKAVVLLGRNTTIGEIITGVIFIILGLIFLFLPEFNFASLDAGTFGVIENNIILFAEKVPNWIFVLGIILLPVLIVLLLKEIQKYKHK